MSQLTKTIVAWVLLIGLFLGVQPLSDALARERLIRGYARPTQVTKILQYDAPAMTGVIVGAMLGGFREVAASMLWMRTHSMWHSGEGTQWDALYLMRMTTLLDPHWLEPWRITAWHCAYNLYVETDDPAEKARMLQLGVDVLKEGISWNPDRYDLYFELGWTYFDKIRDYDEAARWLGAAIRFEHPEYVERLIAHGYERLPDIPMALQWYDYCLKRRPSDETAKGATITIRERYLPAWRLMEERRFDEAIAAVDQYLTNNPQSTIGLHLKAHIYEQAGQFAKAREQWQLAADTSALNHHARYKVSELSERMGLPVPEDATYLFKQQQEEMAIFRPVD
ncbi:MAG: tetratricopeptide repeat protein [candidate division WS1 bacterium]|jgi:tetratricopeptide (TPR) repeat protein|nr:tetratricopeptide repeat protein [candidate division WS1 bacterium]